MEEANNKAWQTADKTECKYYKRREKIDVKSYRRRRETTELGTWAPNNIHSYLWAAFRKDWSRTIKEAIWDSRVDEAKNQISDLGHKKWKQKTK